ncbi:hypothetical protein KQI63_04845 [bacterium]|nr:hypothetical protein [bacterium]
MDRYTMQREKYRQHASRRSNRYPGQDGGVVILFLVVLLVLVVGYSAVLVNHDPNRVEASELDKTFTPKQLRKDLSFLMMTLEDVHPNLYAHVSREEIEAERARIDASLDVEMTRLEFYRQVAPLVNRFKDGHTRANPPRIERREYTDQGALLFPLDLEFGEDEVRVLHNYTSDSLVAPGTQVLGINGIPIEQIEERLLQFVSGERSNFKRDILTQRYRWQQWLVFGFESPFEVTVLRTTPRGSTPIARTFLGLTKEELIAKREALTDTTVQETNYSFTVLDNRLVPDVGYIDFNSFAGMDEFEVFLDTTFRFLREQEIGDLVIDLRGNGGGNSTLGDMLINYLYDQPFSQASRMDIKVSKQFKHHMANRWLPWYLRWYPPLGGDQFKRIWEAPEGGIVSFSSEPDSVQENLFRFTGQIYVLIDAGTYSSATMFAATMKDYGIATLVGEETGGLASHYGEVYPFHLPETKLSFGCSSKQFMRPSGEDDGLGVVPDITIDPTEFRRRPPDDMGLATALNLIREDRRTR